MGGINTTKTKADYDREIANLQDQIASLQWKLGRPTQWDVKAVKADIASKKAKIASLKALRKNAPKG